MTIRSGGDGDNAAEGNRGLARMLSPPGGPRSISHQDPGPCVPPAMCDTRVSGHGPGRPVRGR